jgi:hypothetical protein
MGNKSSSTQKGSSSLSENTKVFNTSDSSRVAGFDLGVSSDPRVAPSSSTLSTEESSLSTSKVSLDDFVLLKTVGKGSFVSSDPQYDYSPNEFLS